MIYEIFKNDKKVTSFYTFDTITKYKLKDDEYINIVKEDKDSYISLFFIKFFLFFYFNRFNLFNILMFFSNVGSKFFK